jgi:hypothetical protein
MVLYVPSAQIALAATHPNVPPLRTYLTMARKSKRCHPAAASSKHQSPRRGEKHKQTKVTPVKETDEKVIRKTKLSFSETLTNDDAPAPLSASETTAITPDVRTGPKQLSHPSPPRPERPMTLLLETLNATTPPKDLRKPPPKSPDKSTDSTNDGDKKPAAIDTPQKTITQNDETSQEPPFTKVKRKQNEPPSSPPTHLKPPPSTKNHHHQYTQHYNHPQKRIVPFDTTAKLRTPPATSLTRIFFPY